MMLVYQVPWQQRLDHRILVICNSMVTFKGVAILSISSRSIIGIVLRERERERKNNFWRKHVIEFFFQGVLHRKRKKLMVTREKRIVGAILLGA